VRRQVEKNIQVQVNLSETRSPVTFLYTISSLSSSRLDVHDGVRARKHEVTLSKPFEMLSTPVTQALWQQ